MNWDGKWKMMNGDGISMARVVILILTLTLYDGFPLR